MPLTNEKRAKRITRRLQNLLADVMPRAYFYRWRAIERAVRYELDTIEEDDSRPSPQQGQDPGIDY